MRLRVLGCSGGIGGNLRTTSFLLDRDVLIDAGTGVSELSLSELTEIDHVFVTHSHLDHIACIPFMVDSVGIMRDQPLTVYASEETLDILKQAYFQLENMAGFHRDPQCPETLHALSVDTAGRDSRLEWAQNNRHSRQSRGASSWLSIGQRQGQPGI